MFIENNCWVARSSFLQMAATIEQEITDEKKNEKARPVTIIKNVTDLQRIKLEKLMKNSLDKSVGIPDKPKEWIPPAPPEFNRNVMGSSAGAGSGEFHVYRHIRRREYTRQKWLDEKCQKKDLDLEYHKKVEVNKKKAEERTEKKRLKRQKRKQKKGINKQVKTDDKKEKNQDDSEDSKNSDSECGDDDDDKEDTKEPDEHGSELDDRKT